MEGLTVKEVAKLLGKSKAWIYELKNRGTLKLNEDNSFNIESVEEYQAMPKPKGGRPPGTFKNKGVRK